MKLQNSNYRLEIDVLGFAYSVSAWLKVRVRVECYSAPHDSYEAIDAAIEVGAFEESIRVMGAVLTSSNPRYRRRLRFTEPCLSARGRKRRGNFVVKIRLSDELGPPPRRTPWQHDFEVTREEYVGLMTELEVCRDVWPYPRPQHA